MALARAADSRSAEMKVRLILFGSPAVEYGGESAVLPFERRTQLLALLAVKRSWLGRAELAAMIWPDLEAERAYRNLRKLLHRVQLLPWACNIEAQSGALRFEAETDVFAFELALREQRIADALTLRRGELLAGFEDDKSEMWSNWLNFERDRLRLAWRDAALNYLATDIDAAEAIELSTRLLDADPLDEAAMRAHMSWLARGGQSALARQAYGEFAERLAEDLGIAPGVELRVLHDALGAKAAPTRSLASPYAIRDDDFIGRAVELRRIGAFLAQDECRLLSLIGPGGVGKSRLAMRAIREFAPRFSDGAAFVPLDDISSSSEIGGRLARELGVDLAGSDEPLVQSMAFLQQRQMLIVLDNFEHLAADTSMLNRLLQACARLKIIVTSRARLAVSGEWLFHVEGLPWPEVEDQDRFEAFDAVRLFLQVARRVQPELDSTLEAAAVVDICRQVEGLPLALELAAAWTRVLSCEAIATELRQGSELLRTVDTAHPARQASMEIVFDRSWRLLSAIERDALSRLSVFRGGFTADAARAITGASLPVLGALTDKSLLRKDGARLFMHPLVQQLAALRLCDSDVRESTERTHALFFHRLLAQSRRAIEDGDREALQRLDIEFENLRIAWAWSVTHDATDAVAKSVLTLMHFCDHRGRFEEGLLMLRDALEPQSAQNDPSVAPLLLGASASLEYRLDHYVNAEATASRALAASRQVDRDTKFRCFNVLGSCSLRLGRHADAKSYFQKALHEAQANTDPHNAAAMLDNLALVETEMGHREEAQRLSTQSLVEHRCLGDFAGEALCLNNLGSQYLGKQEYESAGVHFRQGLAICERHGLVSTRVLILYNLVELAIKTGDYHSAEIHAKPAIDVAEATRNRMVLCMLKFRLVQLDLHRNDLTAARSDLGSALGIAIAVGGPYLLLEGVSCFAEILAAQGEIECARLVLAFAAKHPSMPAQGRDEKLARLAQWSRAASAGPIWPGLELDELVNRVVVETDIAHTPLIATLRGAHSI
jgi:predicted ATPase/DNA-binding SARP family transcriptional activator